MNNEKLTPALINTQFLAGKKKWTAFVTWKAYDLYELGETQREAVYNLCSLHADFLGLTKNDAVNLAAQVVATNNQ